MSGLRELLEVRGYLVNRAWVGLRSGVLKALGDASNQVGIAGRESLFDHCQIALDLFDDGLQAAGGGGRLNDYVRFTGQSSWSSNDFGTGPEPMDDRTLLVVVRKCAAVKPAILALVFAKTAIELKWVSGANRTSPVFEERQDVIRVNGSLPSKEFIRRVLESGEGKPPLIEAVDATVGAGSECDGRFAGGTEERSEVGMYRVGRNRIRASSRRWRSDGCPS